MDRCLKKIKINRKQFQLLGCACMMIAAKFEEVYGPNVEEFVYISDQTYTADEVRCRSPCRCGAQLSARLKCADARYGSTSAQGTRVPCGIDYLLRFHASLHASRMYDGQTAVASVGARTAVDGVFLTAHHLTNRFLCFLQYFCDLALLFYHMVRFKPSKLVASAVYLARFTTSETEAWTPTLHHVTKYNPVDFQDCVEELHRLHAIESQVVNTQRDKAKAVSEKYLADKFDKASAIPACSKTQLLDSFPHYKPS